MKRKIVCAIMIGCMSACMLTGCNSGSSAKIGASEEVNALQNTDLSSEVTDSNTVEDAAAAYQEYLDAKDAMEAADSAKISTEMVIGIKYDETDELNRQRFDIDRSKIDDKEVVDFVMTTETIMKDGEETTTSEDGEASGEENQKNELPGYFYDGRLYYSQPSTEEGGESVDLSEAMTYEDLMGIIGSSYVLNDIDAEYVASAAEEKSGANKRYIFILDNDKMVKYMADNLTQSGVVLADDEGVKINYANVSADIDKNGFLVGYTLSVDAIINDSRGETPFSYNIASAFSDFNKTNIKVRTEEDLAKYTDAEEYYNQLSAEENGVENTTEEVTETDDAIPQGEFDAPVIEETEAPETAAAAN